MSGIKPSEDIRREQVIKSLTDILGHPVTLSGPSNPAHGSSISVYTVSYNGNRLIVRDYRKDLELGNKGVQIVGDFNGNTEEIHKILMDYLA